MISEKSSTFGHVRRRRTHGVWTALTRLTVLTALTEDTVDEIDVVEGTGFVLIFPFAAGDFVSPARQRGQLGQFCPLSTPSILSIQSMPSKPRRRQAAAQKTTRRVALFDDFSEINEAGVYYSLPGNDTVTGEPNA
jgi:hypothetical protein